LRICPGRAGKGITFEASSALLGQPAAKQLVEGWRYPIELVLPVRLWSVTGPSGHRRRPKTIEDGGRENRSSGGLSVVVAEVVIPRFVGHADLWGDEPGAGRREHL